MFELCEDCNGEWWYQAFDAEDTSNAWAGPYDTYAAAREAKIQDPESALNLYIARRT